MFGLVGGPIRSVEKYSSVERMMRIYVGVHDRLIDISSNRVYNVEKIVIVRIRHLFFSFFFIRLRNNLSFSFAFVQLF